jgi:hypothetical protein
MHARIAGVRAQQCDRAEMDPLGHPGKRHYAIRFAGGLQGSSPASVCS